VASSRARVAGAVRPALSRIDVLDAAGHDRQSGGAAPVDNYPNTPVVPVTPLPQAGCTIRYRPRRAAESVLLSNGSERRGTAAQGS
jgi:hypothetical protein